MRKPLSLILGVLALALAGCSAFGAPPAVESAPTATRPPLPTRTPMPTSMPTPDGMLGTVVIWHSWEQPEADKLVQVIIGFQNNFPDVQFDVLYVPQSDLRSRLVQAVQDGIGPTLVFAPGSWGPSLYESGLTVDLSGELDPQTVEALSPAARLAAQSGGAWVGLPYAVEGVVMFRNRSLISSAPATFDDLISLAQAATQGEINGAILERSFFFSGGSFISLGGQWADAQGIPVFDSQQGRLWLSLLRRYEEAGGTTFLTDQDLAAFSTSRAGLIIDGTWNMGDLEQAIGPANLAIDPWPSAAGGKMSGFVQVQSLYLTSLAQDYDRAATLNFMGYFLSAPAQAILAGRNRIPVTLDANPTDVLVAQAAAALAGGVPYPVFPEFEIYSTPLEVMLQSVFDGRLTPEEALAQTQAEIITLLAGGPGATATP